MKSIGIASIAGGVVLALASLSATAQNVAPAAGVGVRSPAPEVSGSAPAATSSNRVARARTASGASTNSSGTTTVDPAAQRPGSFEPGGAFDTSGTTSGTGTGSTSGSGVSGATAVDANGNPVTSGVAVVPGTGGVITDGAMQAGTQANIVVQQPAAAPRTPLLDEAARTVQARDTRRRANGDSRKVEGIAPRTERDLTRQMPDDPVIRY